MSCSQFCLCNKEICGNKRTLNEDGEDEDGTEENSDIYILEFYSIHWVILEIYSVSDDK